MGPAPSGPDAALMASGVRHRRMCLCGIRTATGRAPAVRYPYGFAMANPLGTRTGWRRSAWLEGGAREGLAEGAGLFPVEKGNYIPLQGTGQPGIPQEQGIVMAHGKSRVGLKLKPGARGTKSLVREYGKKLVCVRYRYDGTAGRRYKTAEIIVDEVPWVARNSGKEVCVVVHFEEKQLRDKVKAAGARWSTSRKAWKMPYKTAVSLGLRQRIVGDSI